MRTSHIRSRSIARRRRAATARPSGRSAAYTGWKSSSAGVQIGSPVAASATNGNPVSAVNASTTDPSSLSSKPSRTKVPPAGARIVTPGSAGRAASRTSAPSATRTATRRPSAEYAGSDTPPSIRVGDRSGLAGRAPDADQPVVGDRDEVPAVVAEGDVSRPRAVPVQRLGDRPVAHHVVQRDAAVAQADREQPRLRRVDRQRPGAERRQPGSAAIWPDSRSQIHTARSLPTPMSRLPAPCVTTNRSSSTSGPSRSMLDTS